MDSLNDDNVEEILLRLPSWASLEHAVHAADRFRHIASNPDFLRRFRARHGSSSPRSLLGVFAHRHPLGLPVFTLSGPAKSDPRLVAVARTGDFLLAGLEDDPAWRMDDCRNGRLLLSKGRSLTIYDPVSARRVDISRPQDDPFPNGYVSAVNCLLADEDTSSFRVVSLKVDDRRRLRAVEYDSRVQEWGFHPWATDDITPPPEERGTMYAAGLIFWYRNATDDTSLFVLDTRTMEFSMLCLPEKIASSTRSTKRTMRCSIGETEDGKCCLVYVSNRALKVWLLGKNREWEFQKEKQLTHLLAGHNCNQHEVGKVVAGLVILSAGNTDVSNQYHHYAIDLKNLSVKAKLSDGGFTTVVYPFQVPWHHLLGRRLRSDACFR